MFKTDLREDRRYLLISYAKKLFCQWHIMRLVSNSWRSLKMAFVKNTVDIPVKTRLQRIETVMKFTNYNPIM